MLNLQTHFFRTLRQLRGIADAKQVWQTLLQKRGTGNLKYPVIRMTGYRSLNRGLYHGKM